LDIKTKNANAKTAKPMIEKMYFKGYLPIKASITTIEKIKAAVEKFPGRINAKVIKTGVHSSHIEDLKVIGVSRVLDKYLATKMNNIMAATVEG